MIPEGPFQLEIFCGPISVAWKNMRKGPSTGHLLNSTPQFALKGGGMERKEPPAGHTPHPPDAQTPQTPAAAPLPPFPPRPLVLTSRRADAGSGAGRRCGAGGARGGGSAHLPLTAPRLPRPAPPRQRRAPGTCCGPAPGAGGGASGLGPADAGLTGPPRRREDWAPV